MTDLILKIEKLHKSFGEKVILNDFNINITRNTSQVIIGGSGDLSVRKIIPALFWRFLDNQINNKSGIIVCVRSKINIDELKSKLIPHCQEAIDHILEI